MKTRKILRHGVFMVLLSTASVFAFGQNTSDLQAEAKAKEKYIKEIIYKALDEIWSNSEAEVVKQLAVQTISVPEEFPPFLDCPGYKKQSWQKALDGTMHDFKELWSSGYYEDPDLPWFIEQTEEEKKEYREESEWNEKDATLDYGILHPGYCLSIVHTWVKKKNIYLLDVLYSWTMPMFKKAFGLLPAKKQEIYKDIVAHARGYLETFDYEKELAYLNKLKELEEKEGGYVVYKFIYYNPDGVRGVYRKLEAWIFRRAREGWTAEEMREWLCQIEKDFFGASCPVATERKAKKEKLCEIETQILNEDGDLECPEETVASVKRKVSVHSNVQRAAVYPNPTHDIIKVAFADDKISCNVQVFNTMGQVVREVITTTRVTEIDLSSLRPSMYFVRITGKNTAETHGIIKN